MAAEVASLSVASYFLPIFAFLLVFIIIYALLVKSKVLGDNNSVMLFISFILASFFVVEASLVEFVRFSSVWFATAVVLVFFAMALLAFLPGDKPLEFLMKKNWASWAMLGAIIAFFVISSAYLFNWMVNWSMLSDWFYTDWFGMVLLLLVAGLVSWRISPKK